MDWWPSGTIYSHAGRLNMKSTPLKLLTLLVIAQLLCNACAAQEIKPTGGCMYYGDILKIYTPTNPDTVWYNGIAYGLNVSFNNQFQECSGRIAITLGNVELAHMDVPGSWDTFHFKLDTFHVAAGSYMLQYSFSAAYPSHLLAKKTITVVDTSQSGNGVIPPVAAYQNIVVSPIPASDFLKIVADTTEPITEIRIVDIAGRALYGASPNSTNFSLPVQFLPTGLYFLQAKTSRRIMTKKIAIIH